jgi:hypothetical protein
VNIRNILYLLSVVPLVFFGWASLRGEESEEGLAVEHAECSFFGAQRAGFRTGPVRERQAVGAFGRMTEQVVRQLSAPDTRDQFRGNSRTNSVAEAGQGGTIDRHIFGTLHQQGVEPAPRTSDFEFIRRVSLDLTGRIPVPESVAAFVADTAPDKRAKLVEELLESPAWVDKWTMYFGDLYKNTDSIASISLNRYQNGRQAFYDWIKASVSSNKPYNQMAAELIAADGADSWTQGELNWLLAGRVTGGPQQDIYDQMAVNTAETFLGLAHMNCVMCHNGRGHLDSLTLWGKSALRMDAWGMAAFFSRTNVTFTRAAPPNNYGYWAVRDVVRADYALSTTTGNRPPRVPIGSVRNVPPVYPFSGRGPNRGEPYRAALAREVTSDIQFARATVNYLWKEFFTMALVEPVNQFDPARLDPDNPPPAPWTLQPANARLLNELAQEFASSGYNLKALMRQFTNSEAYQLSSRYAASWKPEYEKLYARHLVRRLWAEEIHDALAQTSNILPTYTYRIDAADPARTVTTRWAMQLPSPNLPGGAAANFLNNFLRGNRDDQDRQAAGSELQALSMMNDNFVLSRTRATGAGANASLLARVVNQTDEQFVQSLYLAVLSRFPNESERVIAMNALRSGNRTRGAENLLWSLYNKVDFFFNY